ncbi:MAG: ABC transporter substrate-binding protein, partial [Pseudomonadota bacterium]
HGYGELTADDVVYSLSRAGDPKRSAVSSDYSQFEKIEAVDPHTVRITLKTPVPSLLGLVANYHGGNIVSKKAAEELGEGFKQKPIGTGPFMFKDYKAKQGISLAANADYFRGKPKIDKLEFKFVPSDSSRELAFKKGELDIFTGKREEKWVQRMGQDGNLTVDVFEPGELRTLHLNTKVKPLDDIRVRKAIAHALNRDDFIKLVGDSVTRKSWSPVPNGYLGHSGDLPKYEHDLDKAKALMKEAGHENGFKLNAIITKRSALLRPMQVIQAQLKKIGIDLELDVVEHSAFHSQIRTDLSPMVLYGAARFPVADTYLTPFYHGNSRVGTPTAVTNFNHCDVADADIDAARKEPDAAKQKELWATAQRKLMENVCSIPLFEQLQVWARRNSVDYGYPLDGALSLGPLFTEASAKQ